MTTNYFAPQVINIITDYLTRNNIEYTMENNHLINIPGYSISGRVYKMQVLFDPELNILVFQIQQNQPFSPTDIHMVLELLNICNSDMSIGKYFLCPHCNRLTYRHPIFLTTQAVTDAQISSFFDLTVQSFMVVSDAVGDEIAANSDVDRLSADESTTDDV